MLCRRHLATTFLALISLVAFSCSDSSDADTNKDQATCNPDPSSIPVRTDGCLASPTVIDIDCEAGLEMQLDGDYLVQDTFSGPGSEILDISDPAHPRRVGQFPRGNFPLARFESYAVLSNAVDYPDLPEEETIIYDISDPTLPVEIANMRTDAIINSRYVVNRVLVQTSDYFMSGLYFIDLSSPEYPWQIWPDGNDRWWNETNNILTVIKDRVLLVPYDYDDINQTPTAALIDVSQPATPSVMTIFATDPQPIDAVNVDDMLYLLHRLSYEEEEQRSVDLTSLTIYSIETLNAPEFILRFDDLGRPAQMRVQDNRLYITDYELGILVFDISAPSAPALLGSIQTGDPESSSPGGTFFDFEVVGDLLYIARGNGGRVILEQPECVR